MNTIDQNICVRCYQTYEPDTITWARNTVLGEEALGYDSNIDPRYSPWFGRGKAHWLKTDVEEYQLDVSRGRCDQCEEAIYEAQREARELCSPRQPSWFDPAYAGERWNKV